MTNRGSKATVTGVSDRARAPAVRVRPVVVRDVPAVVELVRAVLAEFGLRFGEGSKTDDELTRLPPSYADHGGAFWVAADEAGLLLGTCGVFPVAPGHYELRKMYLHPRSRGLGLGKRLLDEAVAWTRARGGRALVLDTTEQMERAIAFYEANGFVRDDAQVRGSRCSRGYRREL
ncbi:MAG TPA: GNAT family N-acetyltransferase [Polyangiaceae bacterium]